MEPDRVILTALEVGAGGREPAVAQAFDELAAKLADAFAGNARARSALDGFLDDPETYQRPLAKALAETGVAKDEAVLDAAYRLLQVETPPEPGVLDQIAERERIRTSDRFTRRAQDIAGLKAHEAATSRQRMEAYWEQELQRRAAVAERKARQQRQELRMVIGLAVIAVLILAITIIVVIVTMPGG